MPRERQTAFPKRRYKSCGLERATLERSKFSLGRRRWVRAGCRCAVRLAPNFGRRGSRPSNQTESGAGAPRSKTFCIGTCASGGFNFSSHSYRVDLNCLKSNVLLASCRQLKLFCRRLGEACLPFSVAGTLAQRARNVSDYGCGRDAWPDASVPLPFARLAGA